jgi:uncharacterized protein (UPF0332 family)
LKPTPLIQDLQRKAKRALLTARELQDRDPDASINRSYYAMFDIAQAALLRAGVPEDKLPRTHNGLIATFSKHAVQSGLINEKVSAALGRAEYLRLLADYTGKSLDANTAKDTVTRAETFMSSVEKAFALDGPSIPNSLENGGPPEQDKVREPDAATERSGTTYASIKPISIEDIQRRARENWLRMRQDIGVTKDPGDRSREEDMDHSVDNDE